MLSDKNVNKAFKVAGNAGEKYLSTIEIRILANEVALAWLFR